MLRPGAKSGRRRPSLAWLGVVPFFVYTAVFLVLPAATVMVGAFQGTSSGYTVDTVLDLVRTANLRHAYAQSVEISRISSIVFARASSSPGEQQR